jgi:hypothetical protein
MRTIIGIYLGKNRPGKPIKGWKENIKINVGFEVLTAVFMNRCISWDIILCSLKPTNISEEHAASIFRIE